VEKRKPHYRLADIQVMVADSSRKVFTRSAIVGGRDMGLEETQMRDVVCHLTNKNLFKSMTTNFDSTIWQDVYHAMTPVGVLAYIKVTGYTDGRPPVIQFKRLEDET
jgi:motility quorum-sensing regulator/GCU-specific mRNA interferase toxin